MEKKQYDIICIGHLTKDKIVTPEKEVYMPGGTSYYFSHGINNLDTTAVRYKLVTSLAEEDMKPVEEMRGLGIEVDVIPSRNTVFFENIYEADQNKRKQRVRAKADPFTMESIADIEAKYIVLGTLLADDFSTEVIKALSERGTLVVDAQGYLREVRDGKVFATDWPNKLEAIGHIDILKVNEEEVQTITGMTDLKEGARQLQEWGVKEVILTLGSYGSLVLSDGVFHEIPAVKPKKVVDATGCGDTYLMGYIYKRAQGADIDKAGNFAAEVSARKLEASGPFRG